MKKKLKSNSPLDAAACSRSSDTPETDALDDKLEDISPDEKSDYWLMKLHARKLERERNALAKKFTRLDKPKYSGDPMLDSVLMDTNPDFREWVHSLPPTYWARYDLSAARIGWEAACKFISENVESIHPESKP